MSLTSILQLIFLSKNVASIAFGYMLLVLPSATTTVYHKISLKFNSSLKFFCVESNFNIKFSKKMNKKKDWQIESNITNIEKNVSDFSINCMILEKKETNIEMKFYSPVFFLNIFCPHSFIFYKTNIKIIFYVKN